MEYDLYYELLDVLLDVLISERQERLSMLTPSEEYMEKQRNRYGKLLYGITSEGWPPSMEEDEDLYEELMELLYSPLGIFEINEEDLPF